MGKNGSRKYDESNPGFTEFLKDLVLRVNEGVHKDLENSQDYLERHELDDYIDEKKGLNLAAIEESGLSAHAMVEIGIHWARHCTHTNWHEAMDFIAEKHGVPALGSDTIDTKEEAEVFVGGLDDLPEEIRQALVEALSKKKKGKK